LVIVVFIGLRLRLIGYARCPVKTGCTPELTPEELEELRAECERVGLPEKVSSTPHAQRP
jgi:hypothetical protein